MTEEGLDSNAYEKPEPRALSTSLPAGGGGLTTQRGAARRLWRERYGCDKRLRDSGCKRLRLARADHGLERQCRDDTGGRQRRDHLASCQ